jgi:hypothetical protein
VKKILLLIAAAAAVGAGVYFFNLNRKTDGRIKVSGNIEATEI